MRRLVGIIVAIIMELGKLEGTTFNRCNLAARSCDSTHSLRSHDWRMRGYPASLSWET